MEFLFSQWHRLAACLLLLIGSAVFSGAETAFFSLPRARIRRLREQGTWLAALVVRLVRSPRRLLVSVLLGNLAINIAYFSVTLQISKQSVAEGRSGLAVGVSVAGVLLLIFLGEFLPKGIAMANATRYALATAVPLAVFEQLILPIRLVLDVIVKALSRALGAGRIGSAVTVEELKAFVRLSGAAGRIESEESEMLEDVIDLGEIRVREVMVPRVDMVSIDVSEDPDTLRELARRTRVSKIMVHRGTRDRILGFVAVKDLLYRPDAELEDLIHDVVAVPETKTVDSLLHEFRTGHAPIALVVDEYGGTAGIVTPEDLLEEVVGEIGDEYDAEEGLIRRMAPGTHLVAGETTLREWEEAFGSVLPYGKYDTVGGFVTGALDRIPRPGDTVSSPSHRLTVLRIRGGRVLSLLAVRNDPGGDAMNEAILGIALLLSGGASFFFSGIETGVYALNRVRLRLKAERGDPRAVRMQDMIRRPQRLISTILIGNHVANYAASYFSVALLEQRLQVEGAELDLLNTLVLTPFLFVFGEITPKNVFRIRAEGLVYRASGPMWVAFVLFRPLALFLCWLGRVTRALPRATPSPDAMLARDRLEGLMGEVVEDGVLTPEQNRMVRNIMRISSVPLRTAMVPVEGVDTVDAGFGREELIAASKRNRRSRLPVRDPESGRLIGVVNVLDLIFSGKEATAELVMTVPSLPESYPVDRALQTLRRERRTMAFVTDGRSRIVGIVTVKDLVEEISGELPVF